MHSSGMRGVRILDGLETLRPGELKTLRLGELETCGLGLVMEPEPVKFVLSTRETV